MGNLKDAIEEERKEYLRLDGMRNAAKAEIKQKEAKELENLMKCLRPATIEDYVAWLKVRYHYYGNRDFKYVEGPLIFRHFVAHTNFHLPKLHGAESLTILVPQDIIYTRKDLGHSNILDFDHGNTTHDFVYVSEEVLKFL